MAQAEKWIRAKGNEPVTKVAAQSLKSRLQTVEEFLPLAAKKYEDDVEYVHQLRVWTRRADAALGMYHGLLPEWRVAWMERQLRRIRKATNDARDDDVFARRLAGDKAPAAVKLLKHVREHRVEAQQAVLEVYERMSKKQGRFSRRVAKLVRKVRLRGKRRKSKEATYRTWAEDHLLSIVDEFFDMAEGNFEDTESSHQFRIVGKKLRYAMELSSPAFGSKLRQIAYPLLESVQDHLGKVNDHASALGRIGRWIEGNDDPERAKYLSEMLLSEQRLLEEALLCFSAWWSTNREHRLRTAFDKALGGSKERKTA